MVWIGRVQASLVIKVHRETVGIKLCIVTVWYIGHIADSYDAKGLGQRLLVMVTRVEGTEQLLKCLKRDCYKGLTQHT